MNFLHLLHCRAKPKGNNCLLEIKQLLSFGFEEQCAVNTSQQLMIYVYVFKNKSWQTNIIIRVPSKHETLAQRWFTVGPPPTTLVQQWTNDLQLQVDGNYYCSLLWVWNLYLWGLIWSSCLPCFLCLSLALLRLPTSKSALSFLCSHYT